MVCSFCLVVGFGDGRFGNSMVQSLTSQRFHRITQSFLRSSLLERGNCLDRLTLQLWVSTGRPVNRHSGLAFFRDCQGSSALVLYWCMGCNGGHG